MALLPDISNITAGVGLSVSLLTCQNLDPAFNAILYDGICERIPTGFRQLWISQLITVIMLLLSTTFAIAIYPSIYSQGCCFNWNIFNLSKGFLSNRKPSELSGGKLQAELTRIDNPDDDPVVDPNKIQSNNLEGEVVDETAEGFETKRGQSHARSPDDAKSFISASKVDDNNTNSNAVILVEQSRVEQVTL